MKKLMVAALALCSMSSWADNKACEDSVDMADSLDFQKMHVECADDPVTLYDPESKGKFLSTKKTVTTYEKKGSQKQVVKAAGKAVAQTAGVAQTQTEIAHEIAAQDNAGVIFNIREPFTITGGPQSALNGLFVQMAQYCEKGWTKEKEWVEPAESGYYLHYQFRCAE